MEGKLWISHWMFNHKMDLLMFFETPEFEWQQGCGLEYGAGDTGNERGQRKKKNDPNRIGRNEMKCRSCLGLDLKIFEAPPLLARVSPVWASGDCAKQSGSGVHGCKITPSPPRLGAVQNQQKRVSRIPKAAAFYTSFFPLSLCFVAPLTSKSNTLSRSGAKRIGLEAIKK